MTAGDNSPNARHAPGQDNRQTTAHLAVRRAEARLADLDFADPRLGPPLEVSVPFAPRRSVDLLPVRATRTGGSSGAVTLPARSPGLRATLGLLAAKETSTRELVEDAIAVAQETAHLGAVVALDEEAARAEAVALDAERAAGHLRGPLHGIPLTVKDIIDVAGLPTRAGSAAYDDLPKLDSGAVARLRDAGALILAKVATHEFALGVATPQCANPHDPSRLSGGSSGGSAIAVATGIGLGSLGTDTRASLRVPASLCGVVGFKPTFGIVPTDGIVPLSWTVDHVGPIARDVDDAGLLLGVLAARPLETAVSAPVVGIVPEVIADATPDVVACVESALGALDAAGCRIVEVPVPGPAELELANDLGLLVTRGEAAAYHRSQGTDLRLLIPEVRDQLHASLEVSAADYLDAQRQRRVLVDRALAAFADCDVIASPTTPLVAPARDDYERHLLRLSRNTIVWSLAGCPAVSLPCGLGEDNLPVGLQLAARPYADGALLAVGRLAERALAG